MSTVFIGSGIRTIDSVMATKFTLGTVTSTDTAVVLMLEHTTIHTYLTVDAFMSRCMTIEAYSHWSFVKTLPALAIIDLTPC